MSVVLSKTSYLTYRECPKNAWIKLHKPEIYFSFPLSEFEKSIIETGNEVEVHARRLFPEGVLVEGRDTEAQRVTEDLIRQNTPIIFQAVFEKDNLLAAIDILKYNPKSKKYTVVEVKATNSVDTKTHFHDLAFQVNLLKKCDLGVEKACVMHLNPEYVRHGELDLNALFETDDVTEEVFELLDDVAKETATALDYLSKETEPKGHCSCIYKGRSAHCTTFSYSNPDLPEYGVHDLARIGSSKKKLQELVDSDIFTLENIPPDLDLSDIQQNQLQTYLRDRPIVEREHIAEELESIQFPIYFLDYETFPSALPRFNDFSPYQQIPFQYSLHVLEASDKEPRHLDFLYTESGDPSEAFARSMQKHIGKTGSVIVWHKSFECHRNDEIAKRLPEFASFFADINARVYDLEDIFKKQYFVHKDFQGSSSIKYILPVLAPELTYKNLAIREGGTAAESWNKITTSSDIDSDEKKEVIAHLRAYCERDTYAMYAIWKALYDMILS